MEGFRKKVDEDWKRQVDQEKRAKVQPSRGKDPSPETGSVSFVHFVTGLAMQAMMALGLGPEHQGQMPLDLAAAKYLIDTLDMLKTKTKGNLSPEEQGLVEEHLYRLRMGYVEAVNKVGRPGGKSL